MSESIWKRIHSIVRSRAELRLLGVQRWILTVLMAVTSWPPLAQAQTTPPSQPPRAQSPTAEEPTKEPQEPEGRVKITPRQAEELFHSIDQRREFDSTQTGLPL